MVPAGPRFKGVVSGLGGFAGAMAVLRTGSIALALVALAAGCDRPGGGEQARLCGRAVPVLHPEGSDIQNQNSVRVSPAAVRIDYQVREPPRTFRKAQVTCVFDKGGSRAGDLTAVETDRGPLPEARLFFLKRFWLAQPAADEPVRRALRPQTSALAYAAQQAVNALSLCAVYASLAAAYALVYGLIGRINLAFGEIAVIGGYASFLAMSASGLLSFGIGSGLVLAALAGIAVAALGSVAVGTGVVGPIHARDRRGQPVLIATAALGIALQEGLRLSQGSRERWLPPLLSDPAPLLVSGDFVVTATAMQILIAVLSFFAVAVVLAVMARSAFGRAWRAFADDPATAALFGVSPRRLIAQTFAFAGGLAGFAGFIVSTYYGTIGFAQASGIGLKALVAAVVGGIGSVGGACLGGVLVGLIETGWAAYFGLSYRDVVLFAVLIAVLVLRPGGFVQRI